MEKPHFLVIGGGVIGINIARFLKHRFRDCRVDLIEKESQIGVHASGRNSGVIHAGFYYSADTLKARFTRSGNKQLTEYCKEKSISVNRCGKLVVARDPSDLPFIDELMLRAQRNNVPLKKISVEEAREIEPRVKTCEWALYSPTTATISPSQLMATLKEDAQSEGVNFRFDCRYLSSSGVRSRKVVQTTSGTIQAGYVVNAAGLYADRIAQDFGFSESYRILPFRGLYLYSTEPVGSLRTHVYPVPNLGNPFLGVHFTITMDGQVKIGPTAVPAFWREQYEGLKNFKPSEFSEIIWRNLRLMFSAEFDFRKLAFEEFSKMTRRNLVARASALLTDVHESQYLKWGPSGIRAQLLNIKTGKLEMDFLIQGDDKSLHVLNAVSPGLTCSLPFSEYVVEMVSKNLRGE